MIYVKDKQVGADHWLGFTKKNRFLSINIIHRFMQARLRIIAGLSHFLILQHRGERRGIGGIFFDDLNDRDPDEIFSFATGDLVSFHLP